MADNNNRKDMQAEIEKYLTDHGYAIVPKGDVGSSVVYEDKPVLRIKRNYEKDPGYRYIEVETNTYMEENGLSIVHGLIAKGWEVVGQLDKYHIVVRMELSKANAIRDAETQRARDWEQRPAPMKVSSEFADVASPLVSENINEKQMSTEQILKLTSSE